MYNIVNDFKTQLWKSLQMLMALYIKKFYICNKNVYKSDHSCSFNQQSPFNTTISIALVSQFLQFKKSLYHDAISLIYHKCDGDKKSDNRVLHIIPRREGEAQQWGPNANSDEAKTISDCWERLSKYHEGWCWKTMEWRGRGRRCWIIIYIEHWTNRHEWAKNKKRNCQIMRASSICHSCHCNSVPDFVQPGFLLRGLWLKIIAEASEFM